MNLLADGWIPIQQKGHYQKISLSQLLCGEHSGELCLPLKQPSFFESLKNGKMAADSRVAESLYQRAIGYVHPDVHITSFQGDVTITPIDKYYPPDTPAAKLWLINRQPDKWRDKVELQEEITIKLPNFDEMRKSTEVALAFAEEQHQKLIASRAEIFGQVVGDYSDDEPV